MIKFEDLRELLMDLVVEELTQIEKYQTQAQSEVRVGFNLSQHKELKIFTRITRDMELDNQEERIKNEPRLMKNLEWQFKSFIMEMSLPIYGQKQFFINYHDSLDAFSTLVFSDSHKEDFENRKTRIEEARAANKFE